MWSVSLPVVRKNHCIVMYHIKSTLGEKMTGVANNETSEDYFCQYHIFILFWMTNHVNKSILHLASTHWNMLWWYLQMLVSKKRTTIFLSFNTQLSFKLLWKWLFDLDNSTICNDNKYIYWTQYKPALTVIASVNCSLQDDVPTTKEILAFFRSLSTVLCKIHQTIIWNGCLLLLLS